MSERAYRTRLTRIAAGAALAGLLSVPGISLGQSLKEQIVGVWRQVSIYNEEGGVKKHFYSDKPVGLTVFDRSGYYISYLSKPDLPKFAANNRQKGTDAEYRAIMLGMIAGFGTYTVDGDTVTIKWIASSYPNRVGTTEKRTYKIAGDELTAVNPTASSGGTSYSKLVRVK
jgi:hypothetical protein